MSPTSLTPPGASKFPPDKKTFSTEEAADYLDRKVVTVRKHIRVGNLKPAGTYGGTFNDRYFYFNREDLDELYERHCYHGK